MRILYNRIRNYLRVQDILFPSRYTDYLEISNENNVILGEYCDKLTGTEVHVGGDLDYAIITFHSDDSVQTRGFVVLFSAVQPSE